MDHSSNANDSFCSYRDLRELLELLNESINWMPLGQFPETLNDYVCRRVKYFLYLNSYLLRDSPQDPSVFPPEFCKLPEYFKDNLSLHYNDF
jgi:hypothetical protein